LKRRTTAGKSPEKHGKKKKKKEGFKKGSKTRRAEVAVQKEMTKNEKESEKNQPGGKERDS